MEILSEKSQASFNNKQFENFLKIKNVSLIREMMFYATLSKIRVFLSNFWKKIAIGKSWYFPEKIKTRFITII